MYTNYNRLLMKNLNLIIALFLVAFLISCSSNNDNSNNELPFAGFYKMDRINSSVIVDLNNDGQLSNNLKSEIEYYFNNDQYDLEIRPNYTNDNQAKLISFYFPEPYLTFEYLIEPNGYVEYARGAFGLSFDYQNEFILGDQSQNTEFAIINELELLINDQIRAVILKKYYDFNINDWRELNIEIVYTKIN